MLDLFGYIKKSEDIMLIKSCVFHYEMEFIHPFLDGNGRMGRLWQTLLLMKAYPVFEFLPLETIIKAQQDQYYESLAKSDKAGESTEFIGFMLSVMDEALESVLQNQNVNLSSLERIKRFQSIIKEDSFSRKEYMRFFKQRVVVSLCAKILADASAKPVAYPALATIQPQVCASQGGPTLHYFRARITVSTLASPC
jgi:Fic family protein